jgi:hypothetical protein
VSESISINPFELYESNVEAGLGFPLGHLVAEGSPVGWLGLLPAQVLNVSRETSSPAIEARKQQV